MSIIASSRPSRPFVEHIGTRVFMACSRCGFRRQVNPVRMHPDNLCSSCRASDRHVWKQAS